MGRRNLKKNPRECSSEFSEWLSSTEISEDHVPRKFPRATFRGSPPSVYSEELSDDLVVLGVSSEILFLGIPSEISEGFPRKNEFPRSYFRELFSSEDNIQQRLMVWNPYLGQTRWIQPGRTPYYSSDTYALGYDNNSCNHKILRYIIDYGWGGEAFRLTTSVKGNTYFMYYERGDETYPDIFLCFDFTRERFGEKLHLPWSNSTPFSSFGEEKLAALSGTEIWVTTKVEPNEVLWTNFLKLDLESISRFTRRSLFIDEEKKRAVIFTYGCYDSLKIEKEYYNAAYIIGENDFFKTVYLGETNPTHVHFRPGKMVYFNMDFTHRAFSFANFAVVRISS
ncbi:hypothetical protein F2Q69_00011977 [Brassica cretica]|uniref:F-box associated beta-propeller type 1 domain-containing protein n=1 Tax=Brassica cretica TaxID=69181 RepID=A0A8S9R5E9_BRACR|nr:hypothetical protein F2Q69_00011977 [Brassica cretica]